MPLLHLHEEIECICRYNPRSWISKPTGRCTEQIRRLTTATGFIRPSTDRLARLDLPKGHRRFSTSGQMALIIQSPPDLKKCLYRIPILGFGLVCRLVEIRFLFWGIFKLSLMYWALLTFPSEWSNLYTNWDVPRNGSHPEPTHVTSQPVFWGVVQWIDFCTSRKNRQPAVALTWSCSHLNM